MNLYDYPKLQTFHIEGVKHVSPIDALQAIKDNEAIILDVREPNEILIEKINLEEVLYHPMSVIIERLQFIPKDKFLIIVCPGGIRSSKVANLLKIQGFNNVANLDGGLTQWKSLGVPIESSAQISCGCGCASECLNC